MSKNYKMRFTLDGDELEAIWHHADGHDEWNGWSLLEVDGFPESMCPEQIWSAAEKAFEWGTMEDIEEDMDFEIILEDERNLREGM